MSQVFISYARSDEPRSIDVSDALRTAGYQVWRDDELPAHRAYADVINERLQAAKAVVVLWSAEAAKSQWVRAEADAARGAATLVQATLDGTIPPIPFNQIQCADLSDWNGDMHAAGWRKLNASVSALAGPPDADQSAPARKAKVSVCVLPFENMSGDAEQEYFSDGISEDITTDLSKVSALGVTARNTAFMFKGEGVDVRDIARRVGVSHVLEGSVRKAGGRVRITAQLIDAATGDHLWAERYDRDLTDIFAIQDEISKAIVEALRVKLLPDEKRAITQRGTSNVEAYNLYLMARQFWVTGSHGDVRRDERVIRICGRAVEIDPDYAKAWGLMALAQANLRFGLGKNGDGGLAAAERALSLDPSVAEAYCVKARHLSDEGNSADADTAIETALRLDPESWEVNKEAARQCMLTRRIPEAARHFEKAISVLESDFHSWGMLITCYRAQGDEKGAHHAARIMVDEAEKVLAQDPSNAAALGLVATGLAILGERDRAREWIDRALLLDPDNLNTRYNFACALANELHEIETALDLVVTTLENSDGIIARVAETDPDMDILRDSPRFQKALADAKARLANKAAARAKPAAT